MEEEGEKKAKKCDPCVNGGEGSSTSLGCQKPEKVSSNDNETWMIMSIVSDYPHTFQGWESTKLPIQCYHDTMQWASIQSYCESCNNLCIATWYCCILEFTDY